MNPYVMNLFIGRFIRQTVKQLKKAGVGDDWGKPLSLAFIVDPEEKITQRMKFENYVGSSFLTDDEKSKFASMLNINIHDEIKGLGTEELKGKDEQGNEVIIKQQRKPCKSIFAIINCENKSIQVQWTYTDGEKRIINF